MENPQTDRKWDKMQNVYMNIIIDIRPQYTLYVSVMSKDRDVYTSWEEAEHCGQQECIHEHSSIISVSFSNSVTWPRQTHVFCAGCGLLQLDRDKRGISWFLHTHWQSYREVL